MSVLTAHFWFGCSRDGAGDTESDGGARVGGNAATEATTNPPEIREVLDFPPELRVDDDSVNRFITRAMKTCVSGDYAAFRLLWSAKEDPISSDQFERGWQAVEEIRIRFLEKITNTRDGTVVYAVYADLRLDPARLASTQETERGVALICAREHDQWCLSRADDAWRSWFDQRLASLDGTDDGDDAPMSDSPETDQSGGTVNKQGGGSGV